MFYLALILIAAIALRLVFRKKNSRPEPSRLTRWEEAESRDVTRPSDPRTKFCFANIGSFVTIKYNGSRRTIRPIRVFTKPQFHKTYVLAEEQGEARTFDIDDMALYSKQMRDLVRSEYKLEKEKAAKKRGKKALPKVEPPPSFSGQKATD